jgi:hypothetical protein
MNKSKKMRFHFGRITFTFGTMIAAFGLTDGVSVLAGEGVEFWNVTELLAQGGPPPGRGPGSGRGRAGRGPGRGPGGRGADPSFIADRDVFHFLLENHAKITRKVNQLPNGVDTVTESDDPEIADKIREHVKAMYGRVEEQRPIHLRDPLFGAVFQHADQIQMKFEPTDKGIRVVETSDNPYVVRLIQAHASVVDGFVKNGFEEAHKNHTVPARDAEQAAQDGDGFSVAKTFTDFDAAYIPALALTNQGKQKPAEIAMIRLREAWKSLVARLDDVLATDPDWQSDKEAVRDAIGAAAHELKKQQTLAAHEALEEIRGQLVALRKRHQWAYDLDALNEFHETMEEIVKPAMKWTAADIDESVRQDLQASLQKAQEQWSVVEQAGFDAGARDLNEAAQARIMKVVQQERQSLTNLAQALESANAAKILQAARAIKPSFAQLYMSFGQFPDQSAP